mmetsp:Transcript_16937/g.56160  ORF Transcript_16937/g.56160 Transcript_16937/m.56160 type:complete len:340 (+) Transcript_16937:202-1221(+)
MRAGDPPLLCDGRARALRQVAARGARHHVGRRLARPLRRRDRLLACKGGEREPCLELGASARRRGVGPGRAAAHRAVGDADGRGARGGQDPAAQPARRPDRRPSPPAGRRRGRPSPPHAAWRVGGAAARAAGAVANEDGLLRAARRVKVERGAGQARRARDGLAGGPPAQREGLQAGVRAAAGDPRRGGRRAEHALFVPLRGRRPARAARRSSRVGLAAHSRHPDRGRRDAAPARKGGRPAARADALRRRQLLRAPLERQVLRWRRGGGGGRRRQQQRVWRPGGDGARAEDQRAREEERGRPRHAGARGRRRMRPARAAEAGRSGARRRALWRRDQVQL